MIIIIFSDNDNLIFYNIAFDINFYKIGVFY